MVSISDLDEQIERLKKCEYLKESEVKALCDKAREILIDESNVQRVDAPVTVVDYLHDCVRYSHNPPACRLRRSVETFTASFMI